MSTIVSRTSFEMSTYVSVEISPATTTSPVVISVSQATRPSGSSRRTASRTESEIWSATLSGCPSVTDSEVKRNSRAAMARKGTGRLLDPEEEGHLQLVRPRGRVLHGRAQWLEIAGDLARNALLRQRLAERNAAADVDVQEAVSLVRKIGCLLRVLEVLALEKRLPVVL